MFERNTSFRMFILLSRFCTRRISYWRRGRFCFQFWLTAMEYLYHKWPRVCSTCRKHFLVFSSFTTYHRVPLVEQELLTLPEHLSSPPVSDEVRVTGFLVLCVCFVDRCSSFCTFSFGHCVVCFSSIYGFWLPLWYLQILLRYNIK